MRLLLLSDVECKALWDYYQPERLEGIDAIISCGDLKHSYLEFLVTMSQAPVFYVPGNHDGDYLRNPPEGCECLDNRIVRFNGLRMIGFGGCMRYNPGPYQYTEKDMQKRINRMRWKIHRAGGVDMVVTHAPMLGYGDAPDPAHQGFACFRSFIDSYQPAWFIHGHVHRNYGYGFPRTMKYGNTTIVNAYERYILEI